MNDGERPWGRAEHLLADLWKLWANNEHPDRAEMEAKAYMSAKSARVIELRARAEKRKHAKGLG